MEPRDKLYWRAGTRVGGGWERHAQGSLANARGVQQEEPLSVRCLSSSRMPFLISKSLRLGELCT